MGWSRRAARNRIVTTCPGFPGVTRVFRELESLGLSKHVPIEADSVYFPPCDVLIFGAYSPIYEPLLAALPRENKMLGFLWTSTVTQAEMSGVELGYFSRIMELLRSGAIDFVWVGSKDWLQVVDDDRVHYIPYPLNVCARTAPSLRDVDETLKHVSLFCPNHPRKNIANQLIAVKLANQKEQLKIHTNTITTEQAALLKGLIHVDHGWMPPEKYRETIAQMNIGLQVSHNGVESLNYVVLDHFIENVPVVMSRGIYSNYEPVIKEGWIEKYMIVEDPTNPAEIADCLINCLHDHRLKEFGRSFVEQYCQASADKFTNTMRRIVK